MPKILSFGNINPEDLKENPLKRMVEWFFSLDKSVKLTFVIFVLTIISIPFIVNNQQTITQRASESSPSSSEPLSLGDDSKNQFVPGEILVKFKTSAPSIKVKDSAVAEGMDLEKTAIPLSSINEDTLPSGLKSLNQKYKIKRIEKIFKKGKVDLSKQYKLELESTVPVQQAIEELKKDPQVEYAEPNYIVKAQAIPNDQYYPQMWNLSKIQMDKAWDITKGSNAVTVAVLDTGIDYTHPELGETKITERAFEEIAGPLSFIKLNQYSQQWHLNDNQIFSINKNRIFYPSDNKIYIYSFDTKTTTIINLFADNLYAIKIASKDDMLAYAAVDSNYLKGGYFLYNLKTNEHKKITDSQLIGRISIANEKIVYIKSLDGTQESSNIYVYDIKTGIETPINPPHNRFGFHPFASVNQIAYVMDDPNFCYEKVNIYNMDDNTSRSIYPPDIGPILDFKDNKILYNACGKTNFDTNFSTNYIYDIITGEYQKLLYNLSSGLGTETKTNMNIQEHGGVNITTYYIKGAFGDGVVFYSKNDDANRIIAFDQNSNRYAQINLSKNSHAIIVEEKKICFLSDDYKIYCHTYDVNNPYPIPDNFFNNRITGGYNFVRNDNDPIDIAGHGTHVAGTIGALVNNGIGISGINWDLSLMAVKVLDDSGRGSTYNIARGIIYASDNGAKIINMSLGGFYPCTSSQTFQDAISYARNAGVTVVVAAGNSNIDAANFSPASCQGVIAVGATGPDDTRSYYSNYGSVVDLAAPGGDSSKCSDNSSCLINSTFPNNQYKFLQGTSMASPHVAGVAAILLAKNPALTPDQIENILKNSGDVITADQPIGKRLNADKALSLGIPSPEPWSSPTPILIPTPIPLSQSYTRVFVTSTVYGGNLGGVTGADAKCLERANVAKLGGMWKAWISDSSSQNTAANRLYNSKVPYKLLDGTLIANDRDDLMDGNIANKISLSELMTRLQFPYKSVLTGTDIKGNNISNLPKDNCNDWTTSYSSFTNGIQTTVGDIESTDKRWTQREFYGCGEGSSTLYCFEQPSTPCGDIGDVNLDGKIGIVDSQMILRNLVGTQTFTDDEKKRADVSADGKISTVDSILIQRYIIKMITTFPACPK